MTPRALSSRIFRTCAVLLVAGAFHEPATAQAPPASGTPRAVVSEVGHDFGPVEPGGRLTHTFTVRNTGTAPLTIRRVDLSEPGMRSRFTPVVPPGGSGRITIEWDITRPIGDLDAHAVIHLSDPTRPRVTYALTGVVQRSIEMRPSSDVFLSLYPDEGKERIVRIVNNEPRPLVITGIRAAGAIVATELLSIDPGRTYDVAVAVAPGLRPGHYAESIEVSTDHPRLAQLRIGVTVLVKDALHANPDVIDFGDIPLHRVSALAPALFSQSLTLKKREGHFAIVSITSDVPGLRIAQSPAGRSDTFGLTVAVDHNRLVEGRLDGSVRIQTDDKDFPLIVIPVHGQVTGAAAHAAPPGR
jgi:hypothetical protein